jgi:hypothetical protein
MFVIVGHILLIPHLLKKIEINTYKKVKRENVKILVKKYCGQKINMKKKNF